jgi:hypothetical protein
MNAGKEDFGRPVESAAAAILLGRRWEIREWKIALSVSELVVWLLQAKQSRVVLT